MPRALSDSLVRPSLVRREQRHRRHVLIGLATLFVLSLSPLFGHHLIEATNWLPVTLEHLGPLCLVALHHLLAPVHGAFHVLLSIGVSYAVFERTRAAWRHARTMRVLPVAATVDPRLVRAAHAVGLDVARVHTVRGLPNPAFTSGWWTPQVYVSQSLPAQLSTDELEAVLAHELAHVRRRDPLRQFAWRALAAVLFWLPAMRRPAAEVADEAERLADDFAARERALPLATAILRLAGAQVGGTGGALDRALDRALDPVVGFQRRDLRRDMLERRVRRLAGEDDAVGFEVPRRSLVGAALMLAAVWASGVMVLHPLPESGHHAAHCSHEGDWQLSHLFCAHARTPGEPCPHRGRV